MVRYFLANIFATISPFLQTQKVRQDTIHHGEQNKKDEEIYGEVSDLREDEIICFFFQPHHFGRVPTPMLRGLSQGGLWLMIVWTRNWAINVTCFYNLITERQYAIVIFSAIYLTKRTRFEIKIRLDWMQRTSRIGRYWFVWQEYQSCKREIVLLLKYWDNFIWSVPYMPNLIGRWQIHWYRSFITTGITDWS